MPSLKQIAAAVCGFATTTLAHGLVSGFVADGKYNQGYICKFFSLATIGSSPRNHPTVFAALCVYGYPTATDQRFLLQWITTTS